MTISSLAEWKRRQQDVFAEVSSNNEDTDAELTYSVISLAYWREMLAADENGTVKSNPLINYDDTVRYSLFLPPRFSLQWTSTDSLRMPSKFFNYVHYVSKTASYG